MNNTKVIVTIGPDNFDENTLRELFVNGLDVVRFNMSYCTHDFCLKVIKTINKINSEFSTKLGVLLDIAGAEVKIGKIENDKASLSLGDKIRVYMDDLVGDMTKFSINYKDLVKDVSLNDKLKIDNGKITLNVVDKGINYLLCEVINPGEIKTGMTLNVPGRKLNIPFLSDKDIADIKFACEHDCDFISLSFVTNAEDVLLVSDLLIEFENNHIDILTKVENKEAYEDIDEIIKLSDGIIVARGDLGVEVALEEVPLMQKTIVTKCHEAGKISIVSTSFLSSMEDSLMPTRAEVSDATNAVLDGTDVILLSDEISDGDRQVETLKILNKIINAAENSELMNRTICEEKENDVTSSVAYSVVTCAEKLKCLAIVAPTISGYTAKKISNLRSKCPIVALSPNLDTVKNLLLCYGVYPVLAPEMDNFDDITKIARSCVESIMKTNDNSKIIITGGYPFRNVKHTNFMKIEEL